MVFVFNIPVAVVREKAIISHKASNFSVFFYFPMVGTVYFHILMCNKFFHVNEHPQHFSSQSKFGLHSTPRPLFRLSLKLVQNKALSCGIDSIC